MISRIRRLGFDVVGGEGVLDVVQEVASQKFGRG